MHNSRRLQLEQAILMAGAVIYFSLTECFHSCQVSMALFSVGQGAADAISHLGSLVYLPGLRGFDPCQLRLADLAAQCEPTHGLTL